jgi:phage/plasmid-like protein (TIGR03299 family)
MSHNLNENGKRMFYTGEKPWHGLGTKLNEPATALEAIQAARLDYKVVLQPIYTSQGQLISGKSATVRLDTNNPLGIVGSVYKIVQNVDAFSFFDVVVGEGQAIYHTAGALGKGEKIWILAKLPKEQVIAREDIVEKYLVLTNSHDGKSALKMYFTPIRVVCQNTLTLSLMHAKEGISIRHTGNIKDKIDEARRTLGIAINFYQQFEQIAKQFVDIKLDAQKVDTYYNNLLGIKEDGQEISTRLLNQKGELLSLFENGKGNQIPEVRHSLWTAYNAATEYADHYKTIKNLDKDPSNKLRNIWFGTGADFKNKAYEQALVLAGIKK